MNTKIPYGFWRSDISASQLSSASIRYAEPKICGQKIYWLEVRPSEKGRSVLVEEVANQKRDLLPQNISVRTRAQEYGGNCYALGDNCIYFINDEDQAIYCLNLLNQQIRSISVAGNFRYADLWVDKSRQVLLAVRETLSDQLAISEIIRIDLNSGEITSLVSGQDFYSNPRLSPCGTQLSFLTWNHPFMPWDSSYCVVCKLDQDGQPVSQMRIAGSENESVFQPQWSPGGQLFFVSDRSNWWNLYRWDGASIYPVCEMDAEFATPQWVFGMSTYGFLDNDQILCCYTQSGQWKLAKIHWQTKTLIPIDTQFCDISNLACDNHQAVLIAASAHQTSGIYRLKDALIEPLTDNISLLKPDDISVAEPLTFPTGNTEAYGFFYPPVNTKVEPDPLQKPPLIVICHGGPTAACETGLNLKIQFWTSRGFAVVDVNYRGSTGYGRHYRNALKQHWGIVDVEDVCNAAEYLVQQNKVTKKPIIIRGSSAGGFTVLAALTFTNSFSLGCSLYGIGDLEALAKDTHKFEAHYLDQLVGPYPDAKAVYHQRSPIYHTEKLNCPVIIFQGLKDKVVPPNQAESMVKTLKEKKIDVEYVTFAEEAHGFRQAETIQTQYQRELLFYQKYLVD